MLGGTAKDFVQAFEMIGRAKQLSPLNDGDRSWRGLRSEQCTTLAQMPQPEIAMLLAASPG